MTSWQVKKSWKAEKMYKKDDNNMIINRACIKSKYSTSC